MRTEAAAILLALACAIASCQAPSRDAEPAPSAADEKELARCYSLWQGADIDGAEAALRAYLRRLPDDPAANDGLSFILRLYRRKPEEAVAFSRRAVAADPADKAKRKNLASALLDGGRAREAASALIEGLGLSGLSPDGDYFYRIAAAISAQGDESKESLAWLERAVSAAPDHPKAWPALHRRLAGADDYEGALRVWRQAHGAALRVGIRECEEGLGRYEAALSSRSADAPAFHLRMAGLYDGLRLYPEALDEYGRAGPGLPPEAAARRDEIASFERFLEKLNMRVEAFDREQLASPPGLAALGLAGLVGEQARADPAMFRGLEGRSADGEEEVLSALLGKFGMAARISDREKGRIDIQYGYVSGSRREDLSMWGRSGSFRSVLLERMERNGFGWWYSDGSGGIAGWCEDGDEFFLIAETLSAYSPIISALADPEAREAWLRGNDYDALAGSAALDFARSPRLVRDLDLLGLGIPASGPAPGLDLADLKERIAAHTYETGVVHEAQHALDVLYVRRHMDSAEQEYRAKLSQLRYADRPSLSLAELASLDGAAAPEEPHALANSMVFRDFAELIAGSPGDYPRIDVSRNISAQLPLLGEGEMRELARRAFERRYAAGSYR